MGWDALGCAVCRHGSLAISPVFCRRSGFSAVVRWDARRVATACWRYRQCFAGNLAFALGFAAYRHGSLAISPVFYWRSGFRDVVRWDARRIARDRWRYRQRFAGDIAFALECAGMRCGALGCEAYRQGSLTISPAFCRRSGFSAVLRWDARCVATARWRYRQRFAGDLALARWCAGMRGVSPAFCRRYRQCFAGDLALALECAGMRGVSPRLVGDIASVLLATLPAT